MEDDEFVEFVELVEFVEFVLLVELAALTYKPMFGTNNGKYATTITVRARKSGCI